MSELESATGHLCRTRGDFEEAVEAFQRSLEALAPGRDTAVQAARQINACNATVWASAATWLASGQGTVVAVEAAAEAHQALQSIPEGPYFPRFLSASMQVTEAQLLAATLQHTPPVGLLRSLERLLAVAESNPERHPSGEPALRVLEAWGLWLCGQDEPARAAAKRAASDATIAGLSTVQGRAQVFVGKRAQAWNGQARLLSQLLQDRESE